MPRKTSKSDPPSRGRSSLRRGEGPPEAMTRTSMNALVSLAFAILFDALRFMCTWLVFFGPALAGAACTLGFGATAVSGTLCTAGAGIAGVFGAEIIGPLGIIMAEAVGLVGWLVIGGWLVRTNSRIFKENALWFGGSLLLSEIPFVGGIIPAFTAIIWKMYGTQIKVEKAAHKKWEKENADRQRQEQQRQLMAQSQIAQRNQAEQQNALDQEWSAQLEQQEDDEQVAMEQIKATNDDRYGIPDDERKAA